MKTMREKTNIGKSGGAYMLRTGVFAASFVVNASALKPGTLRSVLRI